MIALGSPEAAEFLPPLLNQPFAAAATPDVAKQMRASMEVASNPSMLALYGVLAMDSGALVKMLSDVAATDGGDDAVDILTAVSDASNRLKEMTRLAATAEARVIIALHLALKLEWKDQPTSADAVGEASHA